MADELDTPRLTVSLQEVVDELAQRGESRSDRCVELSELSELAEQAELGDDDTQLLHEMLEARGVEVRDDCGREGVERTSYVNGDLAETTTDAMSLFLREVRRHPLLTREQEVELAKRIERGDLRAKERLVNSNLRLVISNARKYQGQDRPLLDLIQEGILGLIRAAEIGQRERKIIRVQRELVARTGRDPTDEEIAQAAELEVREVRDARDAARVVTSLDRPVGEDDATSLGELLASDARGPEEEVDIVLREDALRTALERLPEPEREVVRLRYGINGDEPTPLSETGRRLGMSPDAVREIEQRALSELAEGRELEALRPAA
jgi:RNA polymerase primary sigma factor